MEIDKKLYEEIKEYCDLNGIKAKDYVNGLLRKAFMQDKYGERPFETLKDKDTGHVTTHNIPETVIETKISEILEDMKEGERNFEKFVEEVGPEKYADIVHECLFGDDDKKNEPETTLEPIPDKKPRQQVKKRTIKPVK